MSIRDSIKHRRTARRLNLLAGLVAAMLGVPAAMSAATGPAIARPEPDVAPVLEFDQRLAAVLYRLALANSAICETQMPLTGMILHAQGQYSRRYGAALANRNMFPEPLAVELVVPGSPADRAGIRPGDGLVAINGKTVAEPDRTGNRDTAWRDQVERHLAMLPGDLPIRFTLRRAGASLPHTVTVMPFPACRTRWEVTYDKASIGASDGDTIQMSARFVAERTDEEIAVIAAHELAHTALGHNRKLKRDSAGRRKSPSLRKTRSAEDEADRFSVGILKRAGYDPIIAVHFWQGPGKRYAGGWLRSPSHSSAKDRARMITEEIAAMAEMGSGG